MKRKSIFAFVLVLVFAFPGLSFAMTYKDIPGNHYAFNAIDWVSNPANGSFMVGDAQNNFNPNRTLDKFETAKIFAVAAGYKYAASTISAAEQELFDRSYAEYKPMLDNLAAQFSKWSKTADREIAYLLYKNILSETDVSSFVTRVNGTEQVNLITRQEAIVFMIRLDGKQSSAEAIVLPYHTPFKDDALIRADFKKYIYYAKETGIAGGSDGYINPARNFTRAEMAQMFYNLFAARPQATPAANPGSSATQTITGVIDYVYQNQAITYLYITSSGQTSSYRLAGNATILVNNAQRAPSDLVKGMTATAVVSNNEIISLVASSPSAATPAPVQSQSPIPTPPPTAAPVTSPYPSSIPTPSPVRSPIPTQSTQNTITLYSAEGYIRDVSASPETLTIETKRVKLYGEIITETKAYTLASNCVITRNGAAQNFADISENDIAAITYSGSVLYSVELEEKDRTIFGTLLEKKTVNASTVVLVIEDRDNSQTVYELRVTGDTAFKRNSSGNIRWDSLRVGDSIEAECEYDRLLSVIAEGERTTVRGELTSLGISDETNEITLKTDNGMTEVYQLPSDVYDIYKLRIGSLLTLRLDSREVYGLTINGNNADDEFIIVGVIDDIRANNRFDVEELDGSSAEMYRVRVTSGTENDDTNNPLDFDDLDEGMEVYIVLDEDSDKYNDDELIAASIQILSN